MPSNGLSFWGKIGVRLCPLWTAKSSRTRSKTLEHLARDCGNDKELRRAIVSNENVSDKALETLNVQRLTVVHINDIHATYMEDILVTEDSPGQNPLSRLRGFLDQVRDANPYTIFTFGGDFFEKGSVAELLSKGWSTQKVFEALGFDVAVIGNHDFAWSKDVVMAFSRNEHTEMILSNAEYRGGNPSEYGAKVFTVLEPGKLKIGFFGMVSKGYNELDEITDKDYYPELKMRHDYVECAQEIVDAHRESVDLMFMLSHIGLKDDKEVAEKVEGIDAVLSGHSHDPLEKPVVDSDGTIIAQTDAYARNVVRMDLFVDLDTRRIMHHNYELRSLAPLFTPSNEQTAQVIKGIVDEAAPRANKPLVAVSKSRSKEEIARIAVEAAVNQYLGVDAAFVDVKTVWSEWIEGSITQQKLAETFFVERELAGTPGFSSFYTFKIKGRELIALYENPKTPERWVAMLPEEIDPEHKYTVAMSKKSSHHLSKYFNVDVETTAPVPAELPPEIVEEQFPEMDKDLETNEIWQVVAVHAAYRNAQGQSLDADVLFAA